MEEETFYIISYPKWQWETNSTPLKVLFYKFSCIQNAPTQSACSASQKYVETTRDESQ